MRPKHPHHRWLFHLLPGPEKRRITVVTGARQTGKTTLAQAKYPELRYVNFDDVDARTALSEVRTSAWSRTVGAAVLDEVQKAPGVLEKLKYAFDAGSLDCSVLLGSSRILLLEKIRESLAGRTFLYDLWPLMLSELLYEAEDGVAAPATPPLLDTLLQQTSRIDGALDAVPEVLLGTAEDRVRAAFEHLSQWGGMPALLDLDDDDRRSWLRSYQQTFLERDLADLVRLSDLQPFRTLQELAMLRSGQLLNYSELARDAGIAASTVRRYLEYLNISYQVVLLRPYLKNLTSSVLKTPKLYWVDLGLLRQGTGQWGPLNGALFETLVVVEAHKWVHTMNNQAQLFSYRTRSNRELDLLIETPHGVLGIEIKNRAQTSRTDARTMLAVAEALGERWLGGLVVYRGSAVRPLVPAASVWSMPVHRLFA